MDTAGIDNGHKGHSKDENLGRIAELIKKIVQAIGHSKEQRSTDLEYLDPLWEVVALRQIITYCLVIVAQSSPGADLHGACHSEHEHEGCHH
ncbi:hypothetical protein D3C81_1715890 [compost metagenome]